MEIFSFHSGCKWVCSSQIANEPNDELPQEKSEKNLALDEINRVLSDCFRCNNLIVLAGLGTSLYVNASTETTEPRTPLLGRKIAPKMVDLWDTAKEEAKDNFDQIVSLARFPDRNTGNIESLLSYCKIAFEFIDKPADQQLIKNFISKTEKIIRDKINFVSETDPLIFHSELLRKIARRSERKARAKIFTTNYDLCFEYAARQGRYVIIDGFSHTNPQVFDSTYFLYDIVRRDINTESHHFISNVFHLYKLHGSIDWKKNELTREIERVKNIPDDNPVLIYPRNTKYELAFEQPYFEMMAAFQNAIRQPETGLLIVGFGFNDNHIAEPIISAIQSNLGLKVVVCDPFLKVACQKETPNPHIMKIHELIKNGDARLALINNKFEDIVPVLPDIAAQTELEQHMERIRKVKEQSYE